MTRMDIDLEEERPRCQWLYCAAGEGVAGCGFCFLGGDPMDVNCVKFVPEPEDVDIVSAMLGMMNEAVEC